MLDAIVISDIHSGGYCTRTDDLLAFLLRLPPTKKLILNGDTKDADAVVIPAKEMLIFNRLAELHKVYWESVYAKQNLGETREAAAQRLNPQLPGLGCEIIIVRGNHDPKPEEWAPQVGLGDCQIVDEIVIESGGYGEERTTPVRRFLITHGHQWDPAVNTEGLFHGVGAWLARLAAKYISVKFGRWLRYMTSKRAENEVWQGAAIKAKQMGLDGAICGHTHKAEDEPAWRNPVTNGIGAAYWNEGSFCENIPPTYATISNGEVRLETFVDQGPKKLEA